MGKDQFKINNFDILRLVAALQVTTNHAIEIMHIQLTGALKYLLYFSFYFPGVPIFFFISGFLISKSFENNPRLLEYSQNRILRLYPGLITCVTLSFILIAVSGYMAEAAKGVMDWLVLFIAKTSVIQFYNPDFMRAYGDGVLNGSLWTITVELQFYFLVPIIYSIFKLSHNRNSNIILVLLIVFFLIVNRMYTYIPSVYDHTMLYKLTRVSFLPWFYMFLVGVLVQKNFEFFHKLISGKFVIIFPLYCVIGYCALAYNLGLGNNINPLVYLFLVVTIFSFAYSYPSLSNKLLKGNDISYGVYIYHMPFVNFLIFSGYSGKLTYALYAIFLSIIFAIISWFIVERTFLRLKKHPLNPFRTASI